MFVRVIVCAFKCYSYKFSPTVSLAIDIIVSRFLAEACTAILSGIHCIVEQHCNLACPSSNTSMPAAACDDALTEASDGGGVQHFCSNAAVLQAAVSVLHALLLRESADVRDNLLQTSHIVPALLHAATVHMQQVSCTAKGDPAVDHLKATACFCGWA